MDNLASLRQRAEACKPPAWTLADYLVWRAEGWRDLVGQYPHTALDILRLAHTLPKDDFGNVIDELGAYAYPHDSKRVQLEKAEDHVNSLAVMYNQCSF